MDSNEKNFNYICCKFIEDLQNLINNSGLPLFIIYYLVGDIYQQISDLKNQEIIKYSSVGQDDLIKEETVKIPIHKKLEEEKEEEE